MKKETKGEPVHLNMAPVMNLFLAMIPFLLMCAAFFRVSVVNTSAPGLRPPGSDLPREVKVSVSLQITRDGFVYSTIDAPAREESGTIPRKDGQYDFTALAGRMKDIHDRYPDSDTIVIVPEKQVSYDTLIQTLDVTRERVVDPRLDIREYLFTNAVVSSRV
jgi:biopolymer transport protein ExbD